MPRPSSSVEASCDITENKKLTCVFLGGREPGRARELTLAHLDTHPRAMLYTVSQKVMNIWWY